MKCARPYCACKISGGRCAVAAAIRATVLAFAAEALALARGRSS